MYRLKAFGAFPTISNNNKDEVNRLGELSTYGETFATDRGIFKDTSRPSSLLITFSSLQEISSVESVYADVPPSVSSLVLDIMETLYNRATEGDFDDQELPVKEFILSQWQGTVQNVTVNTMVSDGTLWLPSSIIFEGTSTTSPFQVQIWFSDQNFRNEYDLYTIKVVAPIDNIDRFFDSAVNVQKIVSEEMTLVGQFQAANVVAGDKPPTIIEPTEFEWVDPSNDQRKIVVPWTVVIYGEAGRNIDAIRDALGKWILENTEYAESEWQKLFPDIFGSTEFIFTATFNHVALPDDAVNSGVYSPINNDKARLVFAKKFIRGAGYTDAYIEANLNTMQTSYKSAQLCVIGGYRNRNGVNQIADRFKDFIAVGTDSLDFKRMSDETMKFAIVLSKMLQIAETMSAISAVPRGYMRLIRDGVLYVTATFERTSLIVTSRASVLELYEVTQGAEMVPVTD